MSWGDFGADNAFGANNPFRQSSSIEADSDDETSLGSMPPIAPMEPMQTYPNFMGRRIHEASNHPLPPAYARGMGSFPLHTSPPFAEPPLTIEEVIDKPSSSSMPEYSLPGASSRDGTIPPSAELIPASSPDTMEPRRRSPGLSSSDGAPPFSSEAFTRQGFPAADKAEVNKGFRRSASVEDLLPGNAQQMIDDRFEDIQHFQTDLNADFDQEEQQLREKIDRREQEMREEQAAFDTQLRYAQEARDDRRKIGEEEIEQMEDEHRAMMGSKEQKLVEGQVAHNQALRDQQEQFDDELAKREEQHRAKMQARNAARNTPQSATH